MRPQNSTAEEVLAQVAFSAHGVVTRGQLLRAGITVAEIKQRLRTGALLREHPGVYRVGHRAPSVEARYLAAVLACGDGALLCGAAAGHLLTPTERRVAGVVTRRSRRLDPSDATTSGGIPVTTVARTLVDLAAALSSGDLARACHEAGVLRGTTPAAVERVLARRPNSPGASKLRAILRGDVRVTLRSSSAASWPACARRTYRFPTPTARPADAVWTAAGRSIG